MYGLDMVMVDTAGVADIADIAAGDTATVLFTVYLANHHRSSGLVLSKNSKSPLWAFFKACILYIRFSSNGTASRTTRDSTSVCRLTSKHIHTNHFRTS